MTDGAADLVAIAIIAPPPAAIKATLHIRNVDTKLFRGTLETSALNGSANRTLSKETLQLPLSTPSSPLK